MKNALLKMNIDIPLMEKQRINLLRIQGRYKKPITLTREEQEAIDGLVCMLNHWSDNIYWDN